MQIDLPLGTAAQADAKPTYLSPIGSAASDSTGLAAQDCHGSDKSAVGRIPLRSV